MDNEQPLGMGMSEKAEGGLLPAPSLAAVGTKKGKTWLIECWGDSQANQTYLPDQ